MVQQQNLCYERSVHLKYSRSHHKVLLESRLYPKHTGNSILSLLYLEVFRTQKAVIVGYAPDYCLWPAVQRENSGDGTASGAAEGQGARRHSC